MAGMYSGLHVGQQFSSLDEFKTVVRNISVRQHWELRVWRSNKKSVVIGCRSSPNCSFRVVCRANKNATYIPSLQDGHSCRRNAASPGTTPARAEASHVRFLLSEIPRLFDMRSKIKGQDVVDAVKRYHGYDISMRQAQRALIKLQPRQPQSQNEDAQNHDSSIGNQQAGQQQLEPQREDSEYSGLSEDRWIPDQLQPGLIDDGYVQQNELRHNPAPPQHHVHNTHHPSQAHHPPYVQQPTQVQTHPPAPPQEQASINHNVPQPSHVPRVAPEQIPAPPTGPGHPKAPVQPQSSGHPAAAQMVLTNFKIEFTCTTCGSLNQSFFPNQGNVTSGNYLPQHPAPNQANIPRNSVSSAQNIPGNSSNSVPNPGGYERTATANTRDLHPSWAPGPLNVPIPPTHT